MAPVRRRRLERSAAGGILILAAVVAWVIVDRPEHAPPPRVEAAKPPPPPEPAKASEPSTAEIASALAIELVEIAAPPPPAPALAAPAPAPPPQQQAVAKAAPEPPPPEPVQEAKVVPLTPEPVAPKPARDVVPLQPQPEPPPLPKVTPAVLREAPTPADEIVPLRPTPMQAKPEPKRAEKPAEVTPLRPTPPAVQPQPAPKKIEPYVPAPKMPEPPKMLEPPKMIVRASPPPAPPKPKADRAPAPQTSPAVTAEAVVGEGRAFLKILEQGAGPGIEIRWPAESAQRDRLYDVLVQCLGMRTGLLGDDGRLYLGEGQKGQPSTIDGERYSGFVRRPEGAIARDEEREIGRVRSYHQVRASASAARIFPRRVDAYLIGGLRQFVGDNYLKTKSIRAAYRLRNGQPVVDSIVADGRRIDGVIELTAVANSCAL
jgi:hypothetical protein